jgi:hypothetical protein
MKDSVFMGKHGFVGHGFVITYPNWALLECEVV